MPETPLYDPHNRDEENLKPPQGNIILVSFRDFKICDKHPTLLIWEAPRPGLVQQVSKCYAM